MNKVIGFSAALISLFGVYVSGYGFVRISEIASANANLSAVIVPCAIVCAVTMTTIFFAHLAHQKLRSAV